MNLSLVDISITPYGGDRRQALKNTIETTRKHFKPRYKADSFSSIANEYRLTRKSVCV